MRSDNSLSSQQLSKTSFDQFREYIENRAGIYLDDGKQNSFRINLDTRMSILNIQDYNTYYAFITSSLGEKEFDELLHLLLIKETFFFRDKRQFEALTKHIIPELIERKKGQEIRIWSAGCATGEEPYSLAMSIMESFLPGSIKVSLYATDISASSLRLAKEGIYMKSSMRAMDKEISDKYFIQNDRRYHLNDAVKQRVHFDTVNLVEPYFPFEKDSFDIIFCKNVIIYFRLDRVKRVIRRFYNALAEGGCLFVGHSESLWQISDEFELEEIDGVFLYRKNGKGQIALPIEMSQQKERAAHKSISPYPVVYSQGKDQVCTSHLKHLRKSDKLSQDVKLIHKRSVSKEMKKRLPSPGDDNNDDTYAPELKSVEEMLLRDPKNINAHVFSGRIYANMGLYDKALKKCIDVLEINDLSVDAYLLMGSIYSKIGEKEKALSALKRAIYLDDTSVLSHYYLGNLYKNSNLIEQAIKEYKNVIHIFETNPERKEWLIDEVFTVMQLKKLCARNIEILAGKDTLLKEEESYQQ